MDILHKRAFDTLSPLFFRCLATEAKETPRCFWKKLPKATPPPPFFSPPRGQRKETPRCFLNKLPKETSKYLFFEGPASSASAISIQQNLKKKKKKGWLSWKAPYKNRLTNSDNQYYPPTDNTLSKTKKGIHNSTLCKHWEHTSQHDMLVVLGDTTTMTCAVRLFPPQQGGSDLITTRPTLQHSVSTTPTKTGERNVEIERPERDSRLNKVHMIACAPLRIISRKRLRDMKLDCLSRNSMQPWSTCSSSFLYTRSHYENSALRIKLPIQWLTQ